MTAEIGGRLRDVALGERPADLAVTNGQVLLPETRALYDREVAVVDGRIAALVDDATEVRGPETEVVDADGGVVTPGFVNAHVHIDSFQPFERTYQRVLACGTTSVVTELCEFGSTFGAPGIRAMLDATAGLPVRVFGTAAPQAFLDAFDVGYAQFDDDDREAVAALLGDDRIVGVGEIPWIQVVDRSAPAESLVDRAQDRGATVSGHAAGCSGDRFAALSTLITDDHEAVSADDVRERLENGVHVVGRYGTFRDDIDALVDPWETVGSAELSLSTDWIWPTDIVDEGYMDAVVRRTIEAGIDPVDAVRMATLTPARHFGLDDVGSLSPGSHADVVVLEDLETVTVDTVISSGEVVVEDGAPLVEPRTHEYPDWLYESVNVSVDESTFRVPVSAGDGGAVRGIECEGGTVSSETTLEPAVDGDRFVADTDADVLKIALLDRSPDNEGAGFTGFISGFGLEEGAVATTHTWQTPGVLAVGASDDAMRRAVDEVTTMGGGWVVRDAERTVASFATPIGARCADVDVEESAARLATVSNVLGELGASPEMPALILQAISFTGVPALRMTFSGYADVFARRTVGLDPTE